MNKLLIYTSNLEMMPRDMQDVIQFAQDTPKFYIANVELNNYLANVKPGDNIITSKGNSVYVIKAYTKSLEDLSSEDRAYIAKLTAEYGMRKASITGVKNVIKFESWCKSAKPLVESTKCNKVVKNSNSIKGMFDRLKEMFMPSEAENVRITADGSICVATGNGYVSVNAANELVSYPEEMTLELPVFIISKPKEQLVVGDIIAYGRSYAKVTKIEGDKISAIGYTGSSKTIHTIKDFLFNQTMVRVVVSLAGNLGTMGMNPMLMMALSDKGDKMKSLLPLMMMNQNNGAMGMNPMLMAALAQDGESSIKDLLMMSALSGNNIFGCQCMPQSTPASTPAVAKTVKRAAKRGATKKAKAASVVEETVSTEETAAE